ncbi:MAG: RNA methyltransferase [Actinomycetota bacterium]|nr:RNA methyltransferase [Actinomycetota bacterium]
MALGSKSDRAKKLRKLAHKAGFRHVEGLFLVEGRNSIEAALRSDRKLEAIYTAPNVTATDLRLIEGAERQRIPIFEVELGVLESIQDSVSPQPIVGVAQIHEPDPIKVGSSTVVILDDLRDPGNAGTIIRSAHASGVEHIVFSKESVDPYNPKVVRSTVGSIFFVNIHICDDLPRLAVELKDLGFKIYITAGDGSEVYYRADLVGDRGIVIGNEAHGVGSELRAIADGSLRIPTVDDLESLNASMATTLVLFEAMRQREELH